MSSPSSSITKLLFLQIYSVRFLNRVAHIHEVKAGVKKCFYDIKEFVQFPAARTRSSRKMK